MGFEGTVLVMRWRWWALGVAGVVALSVLGLWFVRRVPAGEGAVGRALPPEIKQAIDNTEQANTQVLGAFTLEGHWHALVHWQDGGGCRLAHAVANFAIWRWKAANLTTEQVPCQGGAITFESAMSEGWSGGARTVVSGEVRDPRVASVRAVMSDGRVVTGQIFGQGYLIMADIPDFKVGVTQVNAYDAAGNLLK